MPKYWLLIGALVCVTPKAYASFARANANTAGVTLIAAPPTGSKTVIKACVASNDNDTANALHIKDSTTTTMVILPLPTTSKVEFPASNGVAMPGQKGAISAFFGEELTASYAVTVISPILTTTKVQITCSYEYRRVN